MSEDTIYRKPRRDNNGYRYHRVLSGFVSPNEPQKLDTKETRRFESAAPGVLQDERVRALFEDPTTGKLRLVKEDTGDELATVFLGDLSDWEISVQRNPEHDAQEDKSPSAPIFTVVSIEEI